VHRGNPRSNEDVESHAARLGDEQQKNHVTDAVLRELRGLTELSVLYLRGCTLVTDVGVRELRDLSALRTLDLVGCTHVTDVGLQHLMSLTALSELCLQGTSTTRAGRNALKAALPALTIIG
jgi:hypothetical protein